MHANNAEKTAHSASRMAANFIRDILSNAEGDKTNIEVIHSTPLLNPCMGWGDQ